MLRSNFQLSSVQGFDVPTAKGSLEVFLESGKSRDSLVVVILEFLALLSATPSDGPNETVAPTI